MVHAVKFSIIIFLIMGMASIGLGRIGISGDATNINVLDFGAIGDGQTDDSQAFVKAWKEACGIKAYSVNLIIENDKTFFVKPIRFEGPCQSFYITIELSGTIIAPNSIDEWEGSESWLAFSGINWLTINGSGKLDGKGSIWWNQVSKDHMLHPFGDTVNKGPDAVTFVQCNNLKIQHLKLMNSPRRHVVIFNSNDATLLNINLNSPETSPNTDGIDISHSTNVQIYDSIIRTGDDCIAIGTSSFHINISNIKCGPGHGISIGSLGLDGSGAEVQEIHVRNCTFTGTQNGARIKTWAGGFGYAKKISFEDITLIDTQNPIFIDQYYCPHNTCPHSTESAIQLSDISFIGVKGTTTTETAIKLSCSKNVGCTNILLDDIDIESANPGSEVSSSCINVHGRAGHVIPPVDCLLK